MSATTPHMFQQDAGYCSVHKKKRNLNDLVPIAGQTGMYRCSLKRECTAKPIDMAMCRIHHQRRKIARLKEVAPGIYECQPFAVCQMGGFSPFSSEGIGAPKPTLFVPPAFISPATPTSIMRWTPSVITTGLSSSTTGPLPTPALVANNEVWCTVHGKLIFRGSAEMVEDSFYRCRDRVSCTSTPLDTTEALRAKGCLELFCGRHNTLRRTTYLEKAADMDSYECTASHPCSGHTLVMIHK